MQQSRIIDNRWRTDAACLALVPGVIPCDGCAVRARCTEARSHTVSGAQAVRFLQEVG